MHAIRLRPRLVLGSMTPDELAAIEPPPLTPFHQWLLTVPADGTPPGDLAAELRDELAAGCLSAADMTPAGVRAHLDIAHTVAGWVPGALARLEKLHRAAVERQTQEAA